MDNRLLLLSMVLTASIPAFAQTGINGMMRYNTSSSTFEGYANNNWRHMNDMTIYKTATESVTSSTVLINDAALRFNLNANEKWQFEFHGFFDQNAGNIDYLKLSLSGPASPTYLVYKMMINDSTSALTSGQNYLTYGNSLVTAGTPGAVGAANPGTFIIIGVVENGATAGNLQLQWAQSTSSVNAIRVLRGSYLRMVRLP